MKNGAATGMNEGGYVKLWRSIKGWEWYYDVPVRTLFLHLLVEANWEAAKWKGITLLPGQFITSTVKLAKENGMSRSVVHRTLVKLAATGEVNIQTNNHWTTVTLINWAKWQGIDGTTERPQQHQRTTDGRPLGTIEEEKNLRREEGKSIDPAFENVWAAFGGIGGKQPALKSWKRLLPDEQLAVIAAIPAEVAGTNPDNTFPSRRHFSTYLNQRGWEDAPKKPLKDTNVWRKDSDGRWIAPSGRTAAQLEEARFDLVKRLGITTEADYRREDPELHEYIYQKCA